MSCTRCERPICPDCLRPAAVGFQCPQCVADGAATSRAPRTRYGAPVATRAGLGAGAVSFALIALNVGMFVATAVTSPTGVTSYRDSALFDKLALVPFLVADQHQYWRLIGAAFLHLGLLHLATNMVSLLVVGPPLERLLGHWRFLSLYLLGGLGGSVSIYLFGRPDGAVVGASGAIFGVFAVTALVARDLGIDSRWILATIMLNVGLSFLPGISLLGHLGGFVTGALAGLAVVHLPRVPARTLLQILAFAVLLAIMAGLVVYRTHALLAIG